MPVETKTFPVYQDLLLQTASAEPGALPGVIQELVKYSAKGFAVDKHAVSSVLSEICKVHAPTAHGSEVAWAIWGAIALDAGLDPSAEKPISQMTDSIVALLALDAQKRGLISPSLDVSLWDSVVSAPAELLGPQWLLAYEASVKSWLPSSSLTTLSSANPYFSNLASAGVSFYDGGIIAKPTPVASPTPAAGTSASSSPPDDSPSDDFEADLSESEGWQDY